MQIDGQIVLTNTLSGEAYTPATSAYLTLFSTNNSLQVKNSEGNIFQVSNGVDIGNNANVDYVVQSGSFSDPGGSDGDLVYVV